MRTRFFTVVALTCATAVAAAQSTTSKKDKDKDKEQKPSTLTLTGCVQKGEAPIGGFTLVDGADTYRLTGVDVRDYIGRRVQIVGAAPRRTKIVGGLYPSPNVAGQAGAMDPARAARAGMDAAATNGTGTPEFRVRSIKPLTGGCGTP